MKMKNGLTIEQLEERVEFVAAPIVSTTELAAVQPIKCGISIPIGSCTSAPIDAYESAVATLDAAALQDAALANGLIVQ